MEITASAPTLPENFCHIFPSDPDWKSLFSRCLWNDSTASPTSDTAENLLNFLINEYKNGEVYPKETDIFAAFSKTPLKNVKAVILGQDPYHEPGQAQGLSFSVPNTVKAPPSLKNIFKERETDIGIPAASSKNDLAPWAEQGVLLLNTVLTVRRGAAGSHRRQGWESFTDEVLRTLDAQKRPIAFVLWGQDARRKKDILKNPAHLILESEHPSPLSAWRGFFGSKPFSKINDYLIAQGCAPISWEN